MALLDYHLPGPTNKWLSYFGRGSGGANANPPGPNNDPSALYSLTNSQKGFSADDLLNDPLFQLANQKADQQYPIGGGSTGDLNRALADAAAKYSYGGPSIDQINQYGAQGQSRIANLYSQLSGYLEGQKGDVGARYAQANAASNAAYDAAAKDIAAASAAAGTNLQQQAAGGAAAQAGVQGATNLAQGAIQQAAATNATNRANALSNLATNQTGQTGILSDYIAGERTEQGAQSGRFQDQVSGLIAKATQEMATAKQNTAQAQQSIRDKYAQAQADAQNKNAAAHTQALMDAVKRALSNQKSGNQDNLSGVVGAMTYALRAGKPELAKKFVDMLGSAKQNAATWNASPEVQIGTKKKTTADEQLQMLMGGVGQEQGQRFNLSDQGLDLYRGDFLKEIQQNPALAGLKKYLVTSPDQARQLGLYQPAFGTSQKGYNETVSGGSLASQIAHHLWGGLTTGNFANTVLSPAKGQEAINNYNRQFTPFVNIDALRQNQGDINTYYNAYADNGDRDLMGMLYNIYSGKYGKGGL